MICFLWHSRSIAEEDIASYVVKNKKLLKNENKKIVMTLRSIWRTVSESSESSETYETSPESSESTCAAREKPWEPWDGSELPESAGPARLNHFSRADSQTADVITLL